MKKLLALLISLGLVGAALAQTYPIHSVPIGQGPGVKTFGFAGPCPTNQTLLWISGTGADPSCGLPAVSITIATSLVLNGVSGRVLFDNAGVAGEYQISGTSSVAMTNNPTFTGTITTPSAIVNANAIFNGISNFNVFQASGVTQTFPASGNLVGTTDAQTLTNKQIDGSEITSGTIIALRVTAINLAGSGNGGVFGTLPFANGGCNAVTQVACQNNVFPTPVRAGDVPLWTGAAWITLQGNTSGTKFFTEDNLGNASWTAASGIGTVLQVNTNGGTTNGPITSTGDVRLDGAYTGFANSNCTIAVTQAASALTVALKDNAGNDPSATSPCNINYRSTVQASGITTLVQQTGATSISTVIGASLGAPTLQAFRFWVVAFNNASTNILALFNAFNASSISISPLDESTFASSTAMVAASTGTGIFYTPAGVTLTSLPYKILGYIEYASSGISIPGSYLRVPDKIQNFDAAIRKPGDIVQRSYTFTTSNTTSNSTTVLLATITKSITFQSAANFAHLTTSGTWQNSAGSAAQGVYQFQRSATALGPAYNVYDPGNITGVYTIPISGEAYDFPNSLAPSYNLGIKCPNSAAACSYPSTAGGNLIIEEIQG